jgi:hypothetical protein
MQTLIFNLVIILVVVTPLFILELLRRRSQWISNNHDWLSLVTWLMVLFAFYVWVLP